MRRRLLMGGDGVMQDLMAMRLMNTMTEYISDEVTNVVSYGFSYQTNLQSVVLPKCTRLNTGSFYGCKNLHNLYLPMLASI